MRHPDRLLELLRYLIRLGLGSSYASRVGLEIRDHWRDIAEEAQLKGFSEEEAAEVADLRLGDPDEIARSIVAKVRGSQWAGRYPLVAFVMVPVARELISRQPLVSRKVRCLVSSRCSFRISQRLFQYHWQSYREGLHPVRHENASDRNRSEPHFIADVPRDMGLRRLIMVLDFSCECDRTVGFPLARSV